MEWQPIETAPRDGTEILLWYNTAFRYDLKGWRVIGIYKDGNFYRMGTDVPLLGAHKPTHWMPLPKPPEDKNMDTKWIEEDQFFDKMNANSAAIYVVEEYNGYNRAAIAIFLRKLKQKSG